MPDNVIEENGLHRKTRKDGYVYVIVSKGMYTLPQSGIITQQLLEERLRKEVYTQSQFTPGLWSHKWRPVQFSLVVDNSGVKYIGKEHAEHLVVGIIETIMKRRRIGRAQNIAESHWNGITSNEKSIYPYQDTLTMPSNVSTT